MADDLGGDAAGCHAGSVNPDPGIFLNPNPDPDRDQGFLIKIFILDFSD